jgi:hypothetical protein
VILAWIRPQATAPRRSWTLQSEKGNPEQPFRASVIESPSDPPTSYLDALTSAGLMSTTPSVKAFPLTYRASISRFGCSIPAASLLRK